MLRFNKTSGAKNVHMQGKGARQFVATPSHIHFGTLTLGSVAHRQVGADPRRHSSLLLIAVVGV